MQPDAATYIASLEAADRKICDLLAQEIGKQLPEAENKIGHAHPVWFLDENPTHYCRTIPSFFMRLRRVDTGRPRTAAAPFGPFMTQPVCSSTSRM